MQNRWDNFMEIQQGAVFYFHPVPGMAPASSGTWTGTIPAIPPSIQCQESGPALTCEHGIASYKSRSGHLNKSYLKQHV